MNGLFRRFTPLFLSLFLLASCDGISLKKPSEDNSDKKQSEQSKKPFKKKEVSKVDKQGDSKPNNNDRNEKNTLLDNNLWRTGTSTIFDENLFNEAIDYAFTDGFYTQAVVVIKNGRLIKEHYSGISNDELNRISDLISPTKMKRSLGMRYKNRNKYSLASSWSVAKSITSALVAVAIQQKQIASLDEFASNYITEWNEADDVRSKIKIRDLMNMRSGLENFCQSKKCKDDNAIVLEEDQLKACINRQSTVNLPYRTRTKKYYAKNVNPFVYSNCDTVILGEIIQRATSTDLKDYADRNLFSKIGIEAEWWQSKSEKNTNYLAYCCIDATPRDFAKFGQLILNYGNWDGEQILPKFYIDEIKRMGDITNLAHGKHYGMQFWGMHPYNLSGMVFYAHGLDDQVVMIDFFHQLVLVRKSLYSRPVPSDGNKIINFGNTAELKLNAIDLESVYAPITLPISILKESQSGLGIDEGRFDEKLFYKKIVNAMK